jgi:hypothetical protein
MQSHNYVNDSKQPKRFQLELIQPFSTFGADGTAAPTPYVVDGLLTQGGLSVLGAKPKVGKSSLSRYLSVCVAKGAPFLGRATMRGEVLLISLEDPRAHVDNALGVLGYNPVTDERIQIVEQVSPNLNETVTAIREALATMPNTRLIIIDHLATFLNLGDLSEYMPTLRGVTQLHNLARDFPHLHVLCLCHAKKVSCDDPFDTILGSTALRGVPDTNVVLLNERGCRVIVSETRVGRAIPATILNTEMVLSAGSDVVRDYSLGESFNQWERGRLERAERKNAASYESRVIEFLTACDNQKALQKDLLEGTSGKTEHLVAAIKHLEADGVLSGSGTPKVWTLNLSGEALALYRLSGN